MRNPATNLCLDTMGKDEKTVFEIGLFSCQGGASANEVRDWSIFLSVLCDMVYVCYAIRLADREGWKQISAGLYFYFSD